MFDFLFRPISDFVKISSFTLGVISKCCKGHRVIDFLLHLPYAYGKRVTNISDLGERDKLTIIVKVIEHKIPQYKSSPYKIICEHDGELVVIIYFNYKTAYLKNLYPINSRLVVSGVCSQDVEYIQITHPDIVKHESYYKSCLAIEPIYSLVANLSNKTMQYCRGELINLIKKHKLTLQCIPDLFDTIVNLHTNDTNTEHKKRIIALGELVANQLSAKKIKLELSTHIKDSITATGMISRNVKLPFELTDAQKKCCNEIADDLSSNNIMNRLMQGDVGSGKTVVAFLSSLIVIENGLQVALLAPTEILAKQHYNTFVTLAQNLNINIDLVIGSNKKLRNKQMDNLKNGTTDIVIGTHALMEHKVEFQKLSLVIIDEQHRFGVLQRSKLIEKSSCPNVLSMTATPIPRTLLLGCYCDVDVSIINEKPTGRKDIKTSVMCVRNVDNLIARIQEVDSQVYWVCPAIEESENLVDINTRYDVLQKYVSCDILHGKMKSKDKDCVLERFCAGEFKVLVSTTVIEVGVDIPNANVIIIEHAERFGLSQLHQLRGRVGRRNDDASCILLYHYPLSEVGKKRLELMREVNDGFILSEADLKLRGAGDLYGYTQSGFDSFRFSDLARDGDLVELAKDIVENMDANSDESLLMLKIFDRINNEILS